MAHKLLSAVEAAERLKISRRTILRLVEKGELKPELQAPGEKGAYFFAASEIEKFRAREESGNHE